MKPFVGAVVTFVALLMPGGALAETSPTPPECPPNFQAMEQVRSRIDQLQTQERISTLNALSVAHRDLVAQVAGQLATAANPDVRAAAKQLDAALTPSESKSILDIASSTKQQMRQLIESASQQMGGAYPPGPPPMNVMYGKGMGEPPNDPGVILLMMAARAITPADAFFHVQIQRPG